MAATPDTVQRLKSRGFSVSVERGAGAGARIPDAAFARAGAELVEPGEAWPVADGVLFVSAPSADEARRLREGALVAGFLAPDRNAELIAVLAERRVTALALERVPRTSRAQAMDALSSQSFIAGYRAALLAAVRLDRHFPLLMTAAGTIRPARVVVMGAGVAGLSAIATARRLGAVVEVSDIRPEAKEQAESLGGRFIDLPELESGAGEGGYAKEVSEDYLRRQRAVVRERVVAADAVITTALVPGRPAPRLVGEDMVRQMQEGAVIVDLAVEQGGNCELSVPGETVTRHGVVIVGERNLPSALAPDASRLYARNLLEVILHVTKDGALSLDSSDEITRAILLTCEGEVRHEPGARPSKEGRDDDGSAADRAVRLRTG